MLSDVSEIRFPSGLWSCGWSRPGGERDSRVQLSEFSFDQSFFFIHSFAFIISTTGNPEGFVRSAEGVILYAQILFSLDVWNIAYGGVNIAAFHTGFVLDPEGSAADFYNVSSLKKSRTAHTVVCVFMEVYVYTWLYLLSVVCVSIWRRKSIMNSEP